MISNVTFPASVFVLSLALSSAETEAHSLPSFVESYIEQADLSYEVPTGAYSSEALENIAYLGLENPKWILADFNGDGRKDWAGFLRNSDGLVELVAVYSFRMSFAHTQLAQLGMDSDFIGYGVILEPPGSKAGFPLNNGFPTPTATHAYPGIHLVWFEKSSVLFYWQGGSFRDLLTGD